MLHVWLHIATSASYLYFSKYCTELVLLMYVTIMTKYLVVCHMTPPLWSLSVIIKAGILLLVAFVVTASFFCHFTAFDLICVATVVTLLAVKENENVSNSNILDMLLSHYTAVWHSYSGLSLDDCGPQGSSVIVGWLWMCRTGPRYFYLRIILS